MMDLNIENYYETDSSDNDENHSKLLNSVSQLDSTQRIKPPQRKEIASEVTEYNLSQKHFVKKNLVLVKELVKVLGHKAEHGILTKKIEKVIAKSQTLPKPLKKPVEEKLKRSIGFENVKKQLKKWNAIVVRNALKDQICFPLSETFIKKQKSSEFLSQFKTPTPLEEEIAKVLKQENMNKIEKEEDTKFPLTLTEMMEKRKEMAQLRAKLSYKQSKAQHQNKIKSKKYHRFLKREKLRQQLKEFEMLQKSDPEAALKKLSELDKTRAQERASLRHRNTGHWAKNLAVKAKYNVEIRKVLAEQLKISRELTQKASQLESSDNEEPGDLVPHKNILPNQITSAFHNPWSLHVSKEVEDFVSGYKKFWSEKQKEINQNELNGGKENEINNDESGEAERESNNENNLENYCLIQNEEISKSNGKSQKSEKLQKKKKFDKSNKKLKTNHKRKKLHKSVDSTSGVWIVTQFTNEPDSSTKKKRKTDVIDTLFDELNDKLLEEAKKKVRKINKKLKKREKLREKGKEKPKQKKESNKKFDLTLKNTNIIEKPKLDIELLENGVGNQVLESVSVNTTMSDCRNNDEPAIIDPKNFIQIKPKRLKTHLPENITGEEEDLVVEKMQQAIIEEAFGDDIMGEFKEMKEEEEKNTNIQIVKSLPGWGEWGGRGIISKYIKNKKKQLLILNFPSRKDNVKKDMIINENENPNLRNHLVKEVPHPFKSVNGFEANIRAPIGRDWVPETAHQKLVQMEVVTKLGTVIEPMSEEEIIRLKQVSKSPYQGIKK